jgi:pimeloyl-ACP methyl ester carboxylesterase
MKVSQGFARVRDGTPIGYSVHGDAAASRAAVLVHSLAMDRASAAAVAVFLRNDPQSYAASCRMLGAADLRHALRAIRVPTAVLVGEEDYATPVGMAQALHDGIEGSTLSVLKNARHLTPLEAG